MGPSHSRCRLLPDKFGHLGESRMPDLCHHVQVFTRSRQRLHDEVRLIEYGTHIRPCFSSQHIAIGFSPLNSVVPPNTGPEISLMFQNDQCFTNDIESGLKLSPGLSVPQRSLFDTNVKEELLLYHLHDVSDSPNGCRCCRFLV